MKAWTGKNSLLAGFLVICSLFPLVYTSEDPREAQLREKQNELCSNAETRNYGRLIQLTIAQFDSQLYLLESAYKRVFVCDETLQKLNKICDDIRESFKALFLEEENLEEAISSWLYSIKLEYEEHESAHAVAKIFSESAVAALSLKKGNPAEYIACCSGEHMIRCALGRMAKKKAVCHKHLSFFHSLVQPSRPLAKRTQPTFFLDVIHKLFLESRSIRNRCSQTSDRIFHNESNMRVKRILAYVFMQIREYAQAFQSFHDSGNDEGFKKYVSSFYEQKFACEQHEFDKIKARKICNGATLKKNNPRAIKTLVDDLILCSMRDALQLNEVQEQNVIEYLFDVANGMSAHFLMKKYTDDTWTVEQEYTFYET